jgi:hypothetical protein
MDNRNRTANLGRIALKSIKQDIDQEKNARVWVISLLVSLSKNRAHTTLLQQQHLHTSRLVSHAVGVLSVVSYTSSKDTATMSNVLRSVLLELWLHPSVTIKQFDSGMWKQENAVRLWITIPMQS